MYNQYTLLRGDDEGMYLLEYINKQKPIFLQGYCNLIECQCGSGKTHWSMDCINNEKSHYYSEHNLYVTDTRALKESVQNDYYKTTGRVANQHNENLNVITYQTLANIIQEKLDKRENLRDYFRQYDTIFLDEVHQLFSYSRKYDKSKDDDERAKYSLIIDNLQIMMNNTILICLSATPKDLINHFFYNVRQPELINNIIEPTDKRKLRYYTTDFPQDVLDMKQVARDIELNEDEKLFVFANTIRELKEYQQILSKRGYSTMALWNDKKYQKDYVNKKTGEIEEHKWKMTDEQLSAREKLLDTGEYDTQVLLLNGAYESGINIEYRTDSQKATIYVMVASSNSVQITQARGRIRHNIKELYYMKKIDDICLTEDEYNRLYDTLEELEEICQNDEYAFINKDGLNDISERLNLYMKYNGQGSPKRATTVPKMNEVLEMLELPFEIVKINCDKRMNGQRIKSYYIIQQK